ncbi:MAG: cytochrome c biogenesis CcdA family protein [Armatimonadota bacterium]
MGGDELSIGAVFIAGILSFLSPCVFPVIPAYLSLISGLSFEEMQQEQQSVRAVHWRLYASAIAFILGFSAIFVGLFGGLSLALNQLGGDWRTWVRIGGGIVVIAFAIHMIGIVRINALFKERRFHVGANRLGILGAFLIGGAFAFGWTPCIGPVLGSVLVLTVSTAKTGLLIAYSAGLALPFLLTAVFVNLFLRSMHKVTRHLRTIEVISGVFLLAMGVVLLTDKVNAVAGWAEQSLYFIQKLFMH